MGTSRLLKKDANGEENSGTERAPLYSVPQGQYVLGIGIIF